MNYEPVGADGILTTIVEGVKRAYDYSTRKSYEADLVYRHELERQKAIEQARKIEEQVRARKKELQSKEEAKRQMIIYGAVAGTLLLGTAVVLFKA